MFLSHINVSLSHSLSLLLLLLSLKSINVSLGRIKNMSYPFTTQSLDVSSYPLGGSRHYLDLANIYSSFIILPDVLCQVREHHA